MIYIYTTKIFKIIKSKRQPKSLKKLLTSAKFTTKPTGLIVTFTRCGRRNCGIWLNLIQGSEFYITSKNGKISRIKNDFICHGSTPNIFQQLPEDYQINIFTSTQTKLVVPKFEMLEQECTHTNVSPEYAALIEYRCGQ